jgi:hypothetical protein
MPPDTEPVQVDHKPTKAQRALLLWMIEQEDKRDQRFNQRVEWSGGDLIDYYSERAVAKRIADLEARGQEVKPWDHDGYRLGGYANHGWRRAGGTALANLRNRGFVRFVRFVWGVPQYVITDTGRQAVRDES